MAQSSKRILGQAIPNATAAATAAEAAAEAAEAVSEAAEAEAAEAKAAEAAAATTTTAAATTALPTTPFEITELVCHIFSFLSQIALSASASSVCREWSAIARVLSEAHLQLEHVRSEAWENFQERFLHAKFLTVGLQQPCPRVPQTSHEDAEVWNGGVMPKVRDALKTNQNHKLQSLSIDMPLGEVPPLEVALTKCPRLKILSLSCLQGVPSPLQVQQHDFEPYPIVAAASPGFNHALPLLSMRLNNIQLTPQAFLSFVPSLRKLTDLCLENIRSPWDPAAFDDAVKATPAGLLAVREPGDDSRAVFWRTVKLHCPGLRRILLSCHDAMATGGYAAVPVHIFPSITAFGVDYRCIQDEDPAWIALCSRAAGEREGRLSSLEILANPTAIGEAPFPSRPRDLLLWEFLRFAPSLEKFKALHIPLTTAVLWGNRARFIDDTLDIKAQHVWDCPRLKTLALSLYNTEDEDGPEDDVFTRGIFGYLSRMCTRLQDLTLVMPCRMYSMESGLCLLMRLHDLRRLAILTDFEEADPDLTPLPLKQDFVWMQGIAYRNGTVTAFPSQEIIIGRPRSVSAFTGNTQCLAKARLLLNDQNPGDLMGVEERLNKMQQEQTRNGFLTLGHPKFPFFVVDGLDGRSNCGSILDIVALLSAQSNRFDTEARTVGDHTREWELAAPGPECAQPWPFLERILLSNGSLDETNLEAVQKRAIITREAMKELRPDVEVVCQYSEYPHLFLEV